MYFFYEQPIKKKKKKKKIKEQKNYDASTQFNFEDELKPEEDLKEDLKEELKEELKHEEPHLIEPLTETSVLPEKVEEPKVKGKGETEIVTRIIRTTHPSADGTKPGTSRTTLEQELVSGDINGLLPSGCCIKLCITFDTPQLLLPSARNTPIPPSGKLNA